MLFKAYSEGEKLISVKANRSIEKYENYISDYTKILHPDNLCLIRIKYTLVGFYGRISGYRTVDLVRNPILLDRKLELAGQVLSVLHKIEPDISSSKGG